MNILNLIKCSAYAGVSCAPSVGKQSIEAIRCFLLEICSHFTGKAKLYETPNSILVAVKLEEGLTLDDVDPGEACQYILQLQGSASSEVALQLIGQNPACAGVCVASCGSIQLFRGKSGAQTSYVARSDEMSFFCSNLRFLNGQNLPLEKSAIAAYLRYLYIPAPLTVYKRVQALVPGEQLSLAQGAELASSSKENTIDQSPKAYYPEVHRDIEKRFLAQLTQSIARALPNSQEKAGLLLSGGKDSSALAVALAKAGGLATALTVGFPESDHCEANDAALVADHLGLQRQVHETTQDQVISEWGRFCCAIGQPMADPASYALFLALGGAFRYFDILIDGTGNDSYFGLHPPLRSRLSWYCRRMLRSIGLDPLFLAVSGRLKLDNKKWRLPVEEFYVSWNGYEPNLIEAMFNGIVHWEQLPLHKLYDDCETPESHMTNTVCGIWEPEAAYRKLVQIASVLGKAVYYPFLDPRLKGIVLAAPPEKRYHKGSNKVLLRTILKKSLPKKTTQKPKGAFVFPKEWLLSANSSRDFGEMFSKENWELLGLGNIWFCVKETLDRYQQGLGSDGGRVYALLVLFTWLRIEQKAQAGFHGSMPAKLRKIFF